MAMHSTNDNNTECGETCCHGHGGFPVLTHYIDEVRKRICHTCALKNGHFHLLGHRKWLCKRHQVQVKSFCITHDEGCCTSCALIFHQHPCKVRNITEIMKEKHKLLEAKLSLREKSAKMLHDSLRNVSKTVPAVETLFLNMEADVVRHFDESFGKEDEWEHDAKRVIDKEYDNKMKKLREEKECALKRCREEAEDRKRPLQETKKDIMEDIHILKRITQKEMEKLKHEMERLHGNMHDMKHRINHFLHDQEETVLKSVEVCAEIDTTFGDIQKMNKVLDETKRITNSISLLRTRRNGKEHYRIVSKLHGSWELIDQFRIPSHLKDLRILGCAFNDDAFFQDTKTGEGYTFDSIKREIVKVLPYDGRALVNYCTPIDGELLLCGRTHAEGFTKTLNGCICTYDRNWQLTKDIHIPKHTTGTFASVSADVDCEGMIVAAEANQSHIYVINPADGSIVKTIPLQLGTKCKRCMCMPSGNVVISTSEQGQFTVLDRQTGKSKRILRDDDWKLAVDFSVDPLSDTIYVVYWDKAECAYAVDEVSADKNGSKKIVTFPLASWSDNTSNVRTYPIVITHSGKLIACNEDNILIFKRTICLNDTVVHL